MRTVTTVAALREAVGSARSGGRHVALVPTMGALHDGHLSLVCAAARHAPDAFTVVSVFVNPTQFGPGEDFEAYPRDLDADRSALAGLGDAAPDMVYAPTVGEMYPSWHPGDDTFTNTTVSVRGLTERLCGATRPGHFDGVCTIVAKLLQQAQPDAAFFGRKDFQQLQVIRRMVADLDMPISIIGVPTVREDDGVAMSSRNAYLDEDERAAARCLSRGLAAAVTAARRRRADGRPPRPEMLRRAVVDIIDAESLARVDYVEVVDPETLAPPTTTLSMSQTGQGSGVRNPTPAGAQARISPDTSGEGAEFLVAVAAYVGPARLIDNVAIGDEADEDRLLDAVGTLSEPDTTAP